MLLWPLGVTLVLAPLSWFRGRWVVSLPTAQQARLVSLAPALAGGSVALNTSAMYAGQAVGTAIGGWMIAHDSMQSLHTAGFVLLLAAMATSAWAARVARRGAVTNAGATAAPAKVAAKHSA
jgi:predicted MFS family arabinose efflux permease